MMSETLSDFWTSSPLVTVTSKQPPFLLSPTQFGCIGPKESSCHNLIFDFYLWRSQQVKKLQIYLLALLALITSS